MLVNHNGPKLINLICEHYLNRNNCFEFSVTQTQHIKAINLNVQHVCNYIFSIFLKILLILLGKV